MFSVVVWAIIDHSCCCLTIVPWSDKQLLQETSGMGVQSYFRWFLPTQELDIASLKYEIKNKLFGQKMYLVSLVSFSFSNSL